MKENLFIFFLLLLYFCCVPMAVRDVCNIKPDYARRVYREIGPGLQNVALIKMGCAQHFMVILHYDRIMQRRGHSPVFRVWDRLAREWVEVPLKTGHPESVKIPISATACRWQRRYRSKLAVEVPVRATLHFTWHAVCKFADSAISLQPALTELRREMVDAAKYRTLTSVFDEREFDRVAAHQPQYAIDEHCGLFNCPHSVVYPRWQIKKFRILMRDSYLHTTGTFQTFDPTKYAYQCALALWMS